METPKSNLQDLQSYLDRLRSVAPLPPKVVAQERASFLAYSITLRSSAAQKLNPKPTRRSLADLFKSTPGQRLSFSRAVIAILITLVLFFGSAGITVYAAQNDLPGQPLYTLKTWSENGWLSLAKTPTQKIKLNLQYSNRRVDEITHLVALGVLIPDSLVNRLQDELEATLQYAAEMDDNAMRETLVKIRRQIESQSQVVAMLIQNSGPAADPALDRIQTRLREQIHLVITGENSPLDFKQEIQRRQHDRQEPSPATGLPTSTPEASSQNQEGAINHTGTTIPQPSQFDETDKPLTVTPPSYQHGVGTSQAALTPVESAAPGGTGKESESHTPEATMTPQPGTPKSTVTAAGGAATSKVVKTGTPGKGSGDGHEVTPTEKSKKQP